MRYKKILLPLQKEQNIHHHCIRIIYKENFFIEFRYNPSDVTFKKITPPAKSIQHVSTINQEICKNVILVFYPPLLETSRSSHLTRTLSDSITMKTITGETIIRDSSAGDQKTGCGERRMGRNPRGGKQLSSGLCAREQA